MISQTSLKFVVSFFISFIEKCANDKTLKNKSDLKFLSKLIDIQIRFLSTRKHYCNKNLMPIYVFYNILKTMDAFHAHYLSDGNILKKGIDQKLRIMICLLNITAIPKT